MNKDTKYAWDYHEATKHSEISLMTQRHYLDFDNRPIPFKIYTANFPVYPLPSDFPQPMLDAISAVSTSNPRESHNNRPNSEANTGCPTLSRKIGELDIRDLATILFFSAGITRATKYNAITHYMRAASATGALYPIELYVVTQDLADIEAGLYHFCPADFSLVQIRKGDYRSHLAAAMVNGHQVLSSPISIILTSFAWRNAWKYQARSYRHWFWDCGVIVANFLATTASMKLPTKLIMGYVDDIVDRLLRLETLKEASIVIAPIGISYCPKSDSKPDNNIPKEIAELPIPKIVPLSQGEEIDYPDIWNAHQNSKLLDREDVEAWINIQTNNTPADHQVRTNHNMSTTSKQQLDQQNQYFETENNIEPILGRKEVSDFTGAPTGMTIGETILRRGSTRRFDKHSSISLSTLT